MAERMGPGKSEGTENTIGVDPGVKEETPCLVCVQCARVFPSARSLLDHGPECKKEKDTVKKVFQCSICSRTFKSMTSLRNHSRTHPVQPLKQLEGLPSQPSSSLIDEVSDSKDIAVTSGPGVVSVQDITLNGTINDSTVIHVDSQFRMSTPMEPTSRRMSLNCSVSAVKTTHRRRSGIPVPVSRRLSLATGRRSSCTPELELSNEGLSVTVSKNATSKKSNARSFSPQNIGFNSSTQTKCLKSTSSNRLMSSPFTARLTPKRTVRVPKYRLIEQAERITVAREKSVQKARTPVFAKGGQKIGNATPVIPIHTPKSSRKLNRSACRTPVGANRSRFGINDSLTPTAIRSTPYSVKKTPLSIKKTPLNAKKTPLSTRKTPISAKKTPLSTKKTPLSIKKSAQKEMSTPGKNTHKCTKCGKCFSTKAQLEVHFLIHVKETPKRCGIAMETVKKNLRYIQFNVDGRTEDTPRPVHQFVCTSCGRSYDQERFLLAHMKTHSVSKPFECSICDKKFTHQVNLRLHFLTHKGRASEWESLRAQPDTSQTSFSKKEVTTNSGELESNVFSVLRTFPSDSEEVVDITELVEQFTCKSCDFKTREPASLLLHMRTHSKRRKYICTKCEKSYSTESNLKVHMKVHTIGRIKNILLAKNHLRHRDSQCLGLERLENALIPHCRKQDVLDSE